MILALDISTAVTGVTVLDEAGKIVVSDAVNFKKFNNLFTKAQHISQYLKNLAKKYSVTHIFIEAALMAFRPGKSSADTISKLQRFNGMVSWMCLDTFGLEPEFIGSTTARKGCGITVRRGEDSKKKVLEHVKLTEPDFVVKLTRQNNPVPGTYDRADSLVIARAGQRILNGRRKT